MAACIYGFTVIIVKFCNLQLYSMRFWQSFNCQNLAEFNCTEECFTKQIFLQTWISYYEMQLWSFPGLKVARFRRIQETFAFWFHTIFQQATKPRNRCKKMLRLMFMSSRIVVTQNFLRLSKNRFWNFLGKPNGKKKITTEARQLVGVQCQLTFESSLSLQAADQKILVRSHDLQEFWRWALLFRLQWQAVQNSCLDFFFALCWLIHVMFLFQHAAPPLQIFFEFLRNHNNTLHQYKKPERVIKEHHESSLILRGLFRPQSRSPIVKTKSWKQVRAQKHFVNILHIAIPFCKQ